MMHLEDLPDLLTVEEAREILRMSKNGIYAAIGEGHVPAIRLGPKNGGKLLVPKAGIMDKIARATQATGSGDTAPC